MVRRKLQKHGGVARVVVLAMNRGDGAVGLLVADGGDQHDPLRYPARPCHVRRPNTKPKALAGVEGYTKLYSNLSDLLND